jgi:hypothetical protein
MPEGQRTPLCLRETGKKARRRLSSAKRCAVPPRRISRWSTQQLAPELVPEQVIVPTTQLMKGNLLRCHLHSADNLTHCAQGPCNADVHVQAALYYDPSRPGIVQRWQYTSSSVYRCKASTLQRTALRTMAARQELSVTPCVGELLVLGTALCIAVAAFYALICGLTISVHRSILMVQAGIPSWCAAAFAQLQRRCCSCMQTQVSGMQLHLNQICD